MVKEKEQYSLKLIDKALKEHKHPVISSSFGKDSMVMLHLVMKIAGNSIPVLHINTGVEFPEVIDFRDKFMDKHNLTLYEAPAFPESFWTLTKKYGYPVGQRGFEDDPLRPTSKCCYYLKKKPLLRAIYKFNIDLSFIGLRAVESMNRAVLRKNYGDYYFHSRNKIQHCLPILDWTDTELWEYIEDEQIEIPSLYYKVIPERPRYKIRLGCWACPQGWNSGKGKWLHEFYPDFYDTLMKTGFAEFILSQKLGTDVPKERALSLLDERPCMFEEFPAD